MGKIKSFLTKNFKHDPQEESGQSLVLIALALVGLIAFAGLAIDVGFIFARGSQLQAAIDSAALAGVVEMAGGNTTGNQNRAVTKSGQFLNANGMPISVTNSINLNNYTDFEVTELGVTEYSLTATWPVETFFLKGIGFRDEVNLTRSATAAIYSLADIYASRRAEEGILGTSNQSVFGPQICTSWGDPFSPWQSRYTPGLYSYRYRILIPPTYPDNILRVEIFDPDSMNNANNDALVIRSDAAVKAGGLTAFKNESCPSSYRSQKAPCLVPTGEVNTSNGTPVGGLSIDQVNPFWFLRVDENRGNGTNSCSNVSNYSEAVNTRTRYELYYYKENADGTVQEVPLAAYTGQDGLEDVDHETDLHWVSPGAEVSFGWDKDAPGVDVPADPGSRTANGFEIDLSLEVPGIVTEQGSGNRFIYLDITAIKGGSENGFDIWAGPNDYVNAVPANVNARNIYALNNPGSHSSKGATVLAMGNLPMNSNADWPTEIPLIYISPEFAGEDIFISLFDSDAGARPPTTFFFDSIAEEDFSLVFGGSGNDPDGVPANSRCKPGSCHDEWVDPPYRIPIPGDTTNCDQANAASDPDCVPFYGGRLIARYEGGQQDTYGWQITITGLPYLVR